MSNHPITKLETYWPYQAVVLADLVSRHTNSILKLHGSLNLSQWRVLAAIANHPGCTSAQVVIMTPMDKGIVSRATSILVKNGLVNKKGDPSDRRQSQLFLTEHGRLEYNSVNGALRKAIKQIKTPETFNENMLEQIAGMLDMMSVE